MTKTINLSSHTWKIKFNSAINPSTVTNSTVYIKDVQDNVYTLVTPSVTNDLISLNNTSSFIKDKLYYLYIEQGVKSTNGKSILQAIKMPFMYEIIAMSQNIVETMD